MSFRARRTLQIIAFLVTSGALAYGLYFILFRPDLRTDAPGEVETPGQQVGDLPGAGDFDDSRLPQPGEEPGTPGVGLPEASPIAQGGPTQIRQLTSGEVLSPVSSGSNRARFYDPNDGLIYDISADGEIEPISVTPFPEAENAIFDNNGNQVILEFPDGSNIIYNISQNKQITMPSHWEEFDFSTTGTEVVAKSINDSTNGQIIALRSDGSQATVIADMGQNANKVDIEWSPNGNFVALSETGPALAGFGRRSYLLIDQNGNAPGSIIADGQNFSSKWTPDSRSIVYSTTDPNNADRPSLWITSASGDSIGTDRKKIDLETWIDKCTFRDNSVMLCAVPREIEDFVDFDYRFNDSIDDLYEVNLLTGRVNLLAESTQNIRMFDLSVSSDRSQLFFKDQIGRLNTIQLR